MMSLSNSPIPLSDLRTDLSMAGVLPETIGAVLQAAREFAEMLIRTHERSAQANVVVSTGWFHENDQTSTDPVTSLNLSSPEMKDFRVRCKALVGAVQGEERRRISHVLNALETSNPDIALFHSLFSDFLGSGDSDPFGASHRKVFDLDETQIRESQDFLQHALFTLNKSSVTEDVRSLNALLQRVNRSGLPEKVDFLRNQGSAAEAEAQISSHGMRETLDQVFSQMRTVATNMYNDLISSFSARFSCTDEENDFSPQDGVFLRQVMHGLYHFSFMFVQKILRELPSKEQKRFSVLCWAQVLHSVTSSLSLHCIAENFAVTIADTSSEEGEIPKAFGTQLQGIQDRSEVTLSPTGHNATNLVQQGMKHAISWSSQAQRTLWVLVETKANGRKIENSATLSTPLRDRLEFTAVIAGMASVYSSLPPDAFSRTERERLQNFTYTSKAEPYAPLSQENFNIEQGGLTMHRSVGDSGFGTGPSQFIDAKTILGDDHPIIEVGQRVHTTLQKMKNHILAKEGSPLARFPALRRDLEESAIPVRYVVFDMGGGMRDDSLIFTKTEARTLGIDHFQHCTTPDDEDMASLLGLQIKIPSTEKEELRIFSLSPDDNNDCECTKPDDPSGRKKLPRRGFARRLITVLEA